MSIVVCILILVGVVGFVYSRDISEFIYDHRETAKRLLLYVATVAVVLAAFAFLPPAKAEVDFYPASAKVIDFSREEGVILLKDGEGNLWKLYWDFQDEVPVEQGDIFSLLMWEAGTPTYKLDDEILDATNSRIKAQ